MNIGWKHIKEKLVDIKDDIIWYIWYKPCDIYKTIRHWLRVCCRFKTHWHFVNYAMFHCHPWDYSYFLNIQYEWLKKSQEYFNHYNYCSEDKKNEINRYQRICIGLLEIMLDKREYWDYDIENKKVIMKIPVNLKNKHRFPYSGINPETGKTVWNCTDIYEHNPDEYYKYKAKYLYFKILLEHAESWWD